MPPNRGGVWQRRAVSPAARQAYHALRPRAGPVDARVTLLSDAFTPPRDRLALAGLAAAIIAQALLSANQAPLAALFLYFVGIVLILAVCATHSATSPEAGDTAPASSITLNAPSASTVPATDTSNRTPNSRPSTAANPQSAIRNPHSLLLVAILALAAGARFYRLAAVPFGLWRDEARHGLEALHLLCD